MSDTKKSSVPSGCVRKTFDLSEDLHKKLRLLAARIDKKEVDIVRAVLEEALKNVQA